MRKSLKTECKQLSVALVSQIRLSNCFSISCVFDSILWEKSWRNRKSCEEKKMVMKTAWVAKILTLHQSKTHFTVPSTTDWLGKDDDELLFSWPILELGKQFLTYPRVGCQGPVGTALPHLFKSPGSLPNLSIFLWVFTPAWAIRYSLRQPTHLQSDHLLLLRELLIHKGLWTPVINKS